MEILITGGNGFVGQHLIKELSSENHNILVLCRKKHKRFYYDIESFPNVSVKYSCDITNFESIEQHFVDIDVVFNLAGFVSFKKKDAQTLFLINQTGTKNVLKACEKYNIKKLIHVSSTAALGYLNTTSINENFSFNWNIKAQKNIYSYSKYLGEQEVLNQDKVPTIVLNPSLILGPGEISVSPKLIKVVQNRAIPFNPPGINSIVDVRDVASALCFLMEKGKIGQKYIVHSTSMSFKELNYMIANELGVKAPKYVFGKYMYLLLSLVAKLDESIRLEPQLTQENIYFAFKQRAHDSNKIKQLGFSLKYTPQQTIYDTIKFLKENELSS